MCRRSTPCSTARIGLYAASKGAIEQFTVVAAHELGPRGITVNTVSPGATDTDMLRSLNSPEELDAMATMSHFAEWPARRGRRRHRVPAGPDGGWMTGQNLRAGGGIR